MQSAFPGAKELPRSREKSAALPLLFQAGFPRRRPCDLDSCASNVLLVPSGEICKKKKKKKRQGSGEMPASPWAEARFSLNAQGVWNGQWILIIHGSHVLELHQEQCISEYQITAPRQNTRLASFEPRVTFLATSQRTTLLYMSLFKDTPF